MVTLCLIFLATSCVGSITAILLNRKYYIKTLAESRLFVSHLDKQSDEFIAELDAEIDDLLHSDEPGMDADVDAQLEELRHQRAELTTSNS